MSRAALRLALALSALAAPALGAGCQDSAEAVATVDGHAIGLGEFADLYASTLLKAGLQGDDPAVRDAVLNTLVQKQLLVADAYDAGVRDTDAYAAARETAQERALVGRWTFLQVGDEMAVTEDDLRQAFVQSQTTYRARHLFAPTRAAAERLRARLDAGETFAALAAETFADEALRASGGDLGEFGHDEMDPALEAVAFEIPVGEVSEPIRTARGYSILRVDERAANPLLTESDFVTKRAQLRRYVTRRKRIEARFALAQRTLDALDPQFDTDALARLGDMARGVAPAMDDEALAAWRATPLVRFDSEHLGDAWTVGDVEAMGAAASDEQRAAIQDEASLEEFVRGRLVRDEAVARARAAGLDRDPAVAAAVETEMEAWVFDEAKRRLRGTLAVPDDSLRAAFAAARAQNPDAYTVPERVRASEILVATRAQADDLRARLRRGADFGELARRHSLRPGAATADGDLGAVTRSQLGRLAEPVFAAAPGAVVGPVEVAGRYALVRRGAALPPRPMTFAEARDEIAQALEAEYAQRRLVARVAELRARYRVDVHRDVLAAFRLFPESAAPAPADGTVTRPDRS